jgi:M6 family metalloprotease-like protein
MKKIFSTAIILLFATQHIFAAPAKPGVIHYKLPDGSEITVQLRGDEWVNWAETPDGFTLLRNSDGFFEYAVQDEFGDLKLSGVRPHNELERTEEERNLLRNLPVNLRYSKSQIETQLELRGMKHNFVQKLAANQHVLEGEARMPVILVGFLGKPFTKTKEEFEMLFNQLNYKPDRYTTGSIRDYFLANSYGKLDLQIDVFGPYTLPSPISSYDHRCGIGGNPRLMATQAVDSAYFSGGADFSLYDHNNDGNVGVHIVFAGYCQSVGAPPCNSIWSHAWEFLTPREYNGKIISGYSCSPELHGTGGTNLTTIGVIAHELGHSLLGLPDFYDADYSDNGVAVCLDRWCVMAYGGNNGGSDNNSGFTPSLISAWGRAHVGWVPEQVLSTATDITMPSPATADAVYRINTKTDNEYFLIENRQRIPGSWDAGIPAGGMLIYHVDRTNIHVWNENEVNTVASRRRYYVKQANCVATNGCADNRATDVWPQSGKTEFTDSSTPNARSWAGTNTEKPITDIVHHTTARTISFKFMGGNEPSNIHDGIETDNSPSIHAWIANGILHIDRLTIGEIFRIYTVPGILVYQSIAKSDVEMIDVQAFRAGVHIIQSTNKSLKITL